MNKLLGMLFVVFAARGICSELLSASEHGVLRPQVENRIVTLQEAVRMTLARSPEVLLAEAQAIRADEALRESRSLNQPQVATGTGLAYNNGFPLSIEGAAPSIFQIGASQSIFSKRNNNLIRGAEESRKATRIGVDSARNALAAKTALVYYELFLARKATALASSRLDASRKRQEVVETLLRAGRVRPVDASLARTASISAQQRLLVAQEQATLAEKELQELTGLSNSASIQTLEPKLNSPVFEMQAEELYRQALESTPEIRQAEANVKAKEFHVEAEKGDSLPRMEIIGQYALFSRTNNYQDFFNRFTRNNFILGLSLQVPLFNGFRTSARVAQSRQELSEEQYRLQGMKSELKLNIQRGLSALRVARGASDLARSDLAAAQEMLQVSETLLESGRISTKELEDSRSQLQQKEMAVLDADQVLFQRKLELLRAVGSIVSAIQ
jgi:outer membrane protein